MRRNPVGLRLLLLLLLLCALRVTAQNTVPSFAQPTVIPTRNWPSALYTADVNADGYPDLIYIDGGATATASTTHVLLGDGQGHFTASAQIVTAGSSLAICDLTGNGRTDVGWVTAEPSAAGSLDLAIHIAPGQGNGSFAAPVTATPFTLLPGTVLGFVTAAHVFADGPAAILFEDLAHNNAYVTQLVNGSLRRNAVLTLPDGPGPATIADLNGDDLPDLAILGQRNTAVQIYLNKGALLGSSEAPDFRFPSASGAYPGQIHSILLQDVNNDSHPDLIAETTSGHIDVYPGLGDGTFTATSIGGTGPLDGLTGNGGHLIAIADLNHDGQLDALAATPAGISTLLGAGTQYLKLGGIYNAGPGHTSYVTADFNGDGNLDLALDSPEGIAILYGNPDGTFQTSRAYAAGAPALSGTLAAFTASGHPDAAVSTAATQAQLLLGAGDGTFLAAPAPTTSQTGTPNLWSTIAAADFNADGHLDLLLTADGSNANLPAPGTVPGVYLQFGDGTGNFSAPVSAAAPLQFTYPGSTSCAPPFDHFGGQFFGTSILGDFDADGIADFANRDSAAYRILRGNNGSASSSYTTSPTLYYSGVDGTANLVDCNPHPHDLVAAGDFNNDGHPDLIFQGSRGNSGALLLYLSDAAYNFPLAGDLSIDGSLTTPGQLTAPNLSSTFGGASTTFNQPYFPGAIATADLDRDGNTDLLVTYANLAADPTAPTPANPNYLYLWFGSGGGKFLTSPAHPVNPVRIQLSRNYYQVATADLNNDGIPDLILSDGYLVSYQLGLGDGTFGPEHHLLAGRGINTLSAADLRGTGTEDLVLANGGAALANPVANHETLAADPDVNTGGITVLLNTLTPKTTAPTLTASPEPSTFYSTYTITADESYPTPQTGTVTFFQDGTQLGTAQTVNGIATYTVPPGNEYLPGTHTLTALFAPVGSTGAAQQLAGTHTITRAPTSITLTPTTPLTVFYGQGIDGTFAVSVVDGNYPATGPYTLFDNGVAVPVCTALPIRQSCPYGNPVLLDAGPHVFSIGYLGDPVNAPSTSPNYPYGVLPDLTTLTLAANVNPAYLGQPVTLTARATGNITTPAGTVTFTDGAQFSQTAPLNNGVATLTVALTLGTHNLTASYPGNLDFNPAASNSIAQQILPDLTAITLTSSKNPATRGEQVTFAATVTGNFLPPDSSVSFFDGAVLLGSGTLLQGPANTSSVASSISTLAVGTHPITAVYRGSASFNPATSAVLNQVIQPVSLGTVASVTTLVSNLNPSAPQQLVTFIATVAVPGVFPTIPPGVVTFVETTPAGATTLGTGTLDQFGIATFQTAALATGTHPITAVYPGATSLTAPTILPSTSATLNQVVTIPLTDAPSGFQMAVTPAAFTLGVGRTGVGTVTITDQSGFNQPVLLSCTSLAPETSCAFLPSATVPAGGGTVTLELFTNAPRDCNTSTPYFLGSASSPAWPGNPVVPGLGTAALLFAAFRRRRKLGSLLLLLAATSALVTLSGCGHCTDLGTRPGSYTVQLTGTAQGGPVTQTRTITIPLIVTIR